MIRSGCPEVRSYCSSSVEMPPWDLGLGCDGQIDVLVAPAPTLSLAERSLLERRIPFALATEVQTNTRIVITAQAIEGTLGTPDLDADVAAVARDFLVLEHSALERFDARSVFIESFIPPPRLLLFGAGEDGRPVARLASNAGFYVVIVDKRPAYLRAEFFPPGACLLDPSQDDLEASLKLDASCYAVVMTHSFGDDLAFVRTLLATPVPYIGLLGPRRRTGRILTQLLEEGSFDEADQSRIYGPVGLDIGAEGAEQVAISVVAEVLAVRSGLAPRLLRERAAPIHVAAR